MPSLHEEQMIYGHIRIQHKMPCTFLNFDTFRNRFTFCHLILNFFDVFDVSRFSMF